MKIQQCIDSSDEFNPKKNMELEIGVEIQNFAYPQTLDENFLEEIDKYKEKLANFKGLVSIHGPFMDINPSSPDKKVVSVTKERYLQGIKAAKELNASYVVFHSQINPSIRNPEFKERKANRQAVFYKELIDEIKDTDITLLIENQFEEDFEDTLLLIEKINSPKVKVCLDLGHVLYSSRVGIEEWIKGVREHLAYIHFHFNDGSYDAHEAPSTNFIKEIVDILKDNNLEPVLSLEYDTDDIESEVEKFRKIL